MIETEYEQYFYQRKRGPTIHFLQFLMQFLVVEVFVVLMLHSATHFDDNRQTTSRQKVRPSPYDNSAVDEQFYQKYEKERIANQGLSNNVD